MIENRNYPLVYPPPEPLVKKKKVKVWRPKGKFRFLDLPLEIRNQIYEHVLVVPYTVDLSVENKKYLAPRLEAFRTCRQIYNEAYPVFYGRNTFRIFPTHDQSFHTKKVLLTRLSKQYRSAITSLELRLGPGWTKPPKTWNVGPQLGLKDCTSVRKIKIFIEIDPSHDVFKGYRINDRFYTLFSSNLLEGMLDQMPSVEIVDFQAFSFVQRDSTLVQELVDQADADGKRVTFTGLWGAREDEDEELTVETMEAALARFHL